MTGHTERGRKGERTAIACAAVAGLIFGCVGEQSRPPGERGRQGAMETPAPPDSEAHTVFADTVSPVDYQVFQTRVQSERPRKVEYRIVTLAEANQASLSKTLRLALDSIAGSDSSLVAVRGILYIYRPMTQRRGDLEPRAWGEWVPLDGWEAASEASRAGPHRVFTYDWRPDWSSQTADGE